MRVPVNLSLPGSSTSTTPDALQLPPQLVRLGSGEVAIIELQGSLQIEGDAPSTGQMVGILAFDAQVRTAVGAVSARVCS